MFTKNFVFPGIFTGVLLRIMETKLLMIFSGAVFAASLIIAAVVSTSLVHIALFFVVCSKYVFSNNLPVFSKTICGGIK